MRGDDVDGRPFTTTARRCRPSSCRDLFEPFRRTVVRSERSRGLGLGLYITEQIIRAHGGRIEVASTPERGTTFSVVLPRADGELVDLLQQQAVS